MLCACGQCCAATAASGAGTATATEPPSRAASATLAAVSALSAGLPSGWVFPASTGVGVAGLEPASVLVEQALQRLEAADVRARPRMVGACAYLNAAEMDFDAALSLLASMAGAVYFHLASTGWQGFPFGHVVNYSYNFEEPALYFLFFALFFFNGAGPLSVDGAIYRSLAPDDED